jgi:hypothetical protein
MHNPGITTISKRHDHGWLLPASALILILLANLLPAIPAFAQGSPPVQEIRGKINLNEFDMFLLRDLQQGQTLVALAETTSGNLDPGLSLVSAKVDVPELIATYRAGVKQLVLSSEQPLVELPALNDTTFLAWDDDSGPGHSAALEFVVPEDGDYYLGVSSALAAAGVLTFGDYRLLLGFDNPAILDGSAIPNGAQIAVQDEQVLETAGRIQEYRGSLSSEKPTATLKLNDFDPGEELTFFVEATSGDLKPALLLRDYAGKPVSVANLQGAASQTSLDYVFPEGGEAYTLSVVAYAANGQQTAGDFRLLAGVNAPQVEAGTGEPNSTTILRLPIEVQTGIKLQQIVAIDQQNEIMTVVGTLKMGWKDPRLAFSPDECKCTVKEYTDASFNDFLKETGGDWPAYTFFNQQGNRWSLSRLVEIMPNGAVNYNERFSTNFQLNFDFKPYPFDTEGFYIHVDMLYPEDSYVMVPAEGFSEIDPENGEDEFILTDFDTSVSSVFSSRIFPTSRFTFHWSAPRYKMYYVFRIFVPILLIIVISYITFFLKDFTRRIEVATGNLLLFIAFSWSLAEEYPRMGYMTFLDAIMAITFIVNALVVVYNVYLKWLENKDQRNKAERIDRLADWVYPIGYVVLFGASVAYFLL